MIDTNNSWSCKSCRCGKEITLSSSSKKVLVALVILGMISLCLIGGGIESAFTDASRLGKWAWDFVGIGAVGLLLTIGGSVYFVNHCRNQQPVKT